MEVIVKDLAWLKASMDKFAGKDAEFSHGGRGVISHFNVAEKGKNFAISVITPWFAIFEKDHWTMVSGKGCEKAMLNPKIELLSGRAVRLSCSDPDLGYVVIQFGYANIVPQGGHASRR